MANKIGIQIAKPESDFSKIKVGKSTLSGDIAAIIDNRYTRRHCFAHPAMTRESIEKAIETHDVKRMRFISNHFFQTSGIYARLCRYMAYLFKYDWYITPRKYDEKIKDDKVKEGWAKSSIYLENSDIKKVFGKIALKVVVNGCYYGYIMRDSDAAYLQELPPDFCRSRYELNGRPTVEFNIAYFDEIYADADYRTRVLKLYPKEIQKAYVAYKTHKMERDYVGDEIGWILLDPALSVKFGLNFNDAPLFINVIPALLDLDDAKQLDKDKMAQQLLKLIIQEMPMDKNGDLIFTLEETQAFHNNAVDMVGDSIGLQVLTTFADVQVADLSDKSNVTSVDQLERVERTVYNEAGTPQGLFNTDGNIALEKSIANDEAMMLDLLYQFKNFAQLLLEPFNKNPNRLKYSVGILPTTIYNYKDLAKLYKEQTQLGFSKLLPQIALGHLQSDVIMTALFENETMSLNDLFIPPQMSSTMSGNKATASGNGNGSSSSNGAGRPELPNDQKSEKTIQNREAMK